ncbi:CST complex subunit CTC1 isoform X1 [Polypterus senegalus]|uniref:CST complex subunit CTC1 isoform X1 n=1 Tax=Polypterus senegalus TaxID=55291 RepID=UPI0019628A3F|nr:CST complex subunit CTC1 isoform X1 [Polypterus senegalus]
MDLLLKQFGSLSSAEVVWLEDLYSFTQKHLLPVARNAAPELPLALLNLVQELVNQNIASKEGGSVLPISYRFISISELIHVQNKPCCSHLMWSTKDFKEWAKKGENLVPDHKALSRANLILVGCLTGYCEDQLQQVYDGSLNIRDGSGTIFCEVLNPKLEWLDALMLFPGWIFIPQGPDYFGRKVGSYLEITERPLPIVTSLNASILPEPGIVSALDSNNAYWLLMHKNKWHGLKIAVFGTLSHLCPVLKIQDKTFFYFRLQESLAENSSTVPVVVTECRKLCWHYFLQVGEGYLITALRICFLKTTGQRLFCITPESHFWPLDSAPQISKISWKLVMHSSKERIPELKEEQETPIEELPESQSLLKENCKQTCQRKKISKVISYKGVITRVLNSAAGLFELDREVGLCLAYQQLVNGGRGLRPGAKIELHHVHFLYCRTEGFPSAMLSCCLHSTVKVAEFSSLESEFQPFTHDKNLYIHALVKGELGLPEYMWLCRTITSLSDRFCPKYVKPVQMASSWNGVAGRFLRASLIIKEANHIHSRDIYREMLGYPHHCPLQEYNTFTPSWHVPPIADLKTMIESQGWQSLSLTSLPPRAKLQHLTSSELNINLSWSIYTYSSQNLKIPVVLVGVLKSTYRSSCLQLVDQTGELDCVIVQKSLKGGDTTALKETSWSGCLLMIKEFTLVMERFLKTNFPSWKQLEDPKFVQEKKSRVYAVFCIDDAKILSHSTAMSKHFALAMSSKIESKSSPASEQSNDYIKFSKEKEMFCSKENNIKLSGKRKAKSLRQSIENDEHEYLNSKKRLISSDWEDRLVQQDTSQVKEQRTVRASSETTRWGSKSSKRCEENFLECHNVELSSSGSCKSILLYVNGKTGLGWRNIHTDIVPGKARLRRCFSVNAWQVTRPRVWTRNPQNTIETEEAEELAEKTKWKPVDLQFIGVTSHWFPFIQPGIFYRLVAPNKSDDSAFTQFYSSGLFDQVLHKSKCPVIIPVKKDWHVYCLSHPYPLHQGEVDVEDKLCSVAETLLDRSVSCLVSFTCVITERISLENENKPLSASLLQDTKQGVPSEECLKIRLTVRDTELSYQTLHIYMDFSQICYIPGLVPGAHICFYRLERKISRFNTVYCSYGTLSSLTIMGYHFLGNNATDHYNTTSALVHLGDWASGLQNWRQGRVLCHVTCVLSLELKWMCSLCSAIFKQGHCTRDNPVCNSENGIFSSEAKIVVEDGTGEAQVLFSDDIISELLHLSASEWDGLQKLIRVRGHVKYINLGRSAEHWVTEECEDVLLHFLSALCSSSHVCRALILTCKMTPWCKSTEQRIKLANLKRFCRGDREYLTKIPSPLLLDCESLQEADGLALQELQKDHLASSYQRTSIANHS